MSMRFSKVGIPDLTRHNLCACPYVMRTPRIVSEEAFLPINVGVHARQIVFHQPSVPSEPAIERHPVVDELSHCHPLLLLLKEDS